MRIIRSVNLIIIKNTLQCKQLRPNSLEFRITSIMEINSKLNQYKEIIRNLDISKLQKTSDIPVELQIANQGNISINYIPFDYVNTQAKIVLVGITPGFTQLKNALIEAQKQIKEGANELCILQAAKKTGAFSGAMRPNLVAMLDYLKINELLNIPSSDALFGNAIHLIHTTSVLRHPVFLDGQNYNGTPSMTKHPLLLKFLTEYFAKEAAIFRNAIFVPLGPKVSEAMAWLVKEGLMSGANILDGLPHPSGANAERIAYFLDKKEANKLSSKTDPIKIDLSKAEMIKKIKRLAS